LEEEEEWKINTPLAPEPPMGRRGLNPTLLWLQTNIQPRSFLDSMPSPTFEVRASPHESIGMQCKHPPTESLGDGENPCGAFDCSPNGGLRIGVNSSGTYNFPYPVFLAPRNSEVQEMSHIRQAVSGHVPRVRDNCAVCGRIFWKRITTRVFGQRVCSKDCFFVFEGVDIPSTPSSGGSV